MGELDIPTDPEPTVPPFADNARPEDWLLMPYLFVDDVVVAFPTVTTLAEPVLVEEFKKLELVYIL